VGDTRPVRRRGRRVAVPAQPSLFDEPFDAPTDPATIDPGGTALPATSRAQDRATGVAAPAPIPERITPPAEPASTQAAEAARQVVATDYRPSTTIHVPSGAKARARANIAAITLVRQLEGEDRPVAPDEQETLAGWSGWGAVPQIFDGRQEWTTENVQLRGLLSQQEYRRAEANTLNAHHANDKLGTHWTLHDLRHTAAQRMVDDPRLSLTDVQWVLGHAHLTTTELSLRPREEDVVARVLGHHRRRGEPAAPARPALFHT